MNPKIAQKTGTTSNSIIKPKPKIGLKDKVTLAPVIKSGDIRKKLDLLVKAKPRVQPKNDSDEEVEEGNDKADEDSEVSYSARFSPRKVTHRLRSHRPSESLRDCSPLFVGPTYAHGILLCESFT